MFLTDMFTLLCTELEVWYVQFFQQEKKEHLSTVMLTDCWTRARTISVFQILCIFLSFEPSFILWLREKLRSLKWRVRFLAKSILQSAHLQTLLRGANILVGSLFSIAQRRRKIPGLWPHQRIVAVWLIRRSSSLTTLPAPVWFFIGVYICLVDI